jgi:hypothetical protein
MQRNATRRDKACPVPETAPRLASGGLGPGLFLLAVVADLLDCRGGRLALCCAQVHLQLSRIAGNEALALLPEELPLEPGEPLF